jgi:hypothetical protein
MPSNRIPYELFRNYGTLIGLGIGAGLITASLYNVEGGHRANVYSYFGGGSNLKSTLKVLICESPFLSDQLYMT